MALAISILGTRIRSTTNATSYVYAAVTPTGSAGVLMFAMNTVSAGGTEQPTISSPSWLTGAGWTLEGTQDTGSMRMTVWSGYTVASPGSASVTVSTTATQDGCHLDLIQVTGQDTTDFVRQVKAGTINGGSFTSASITLDNALRDSTCAIISCISQNTNAAMSSTSGGTTLGEGGSNTPSRRTYSQYEINDTTSSCSWTGTSDTMRGFAVEVVPPTSFIETRRKQYLQAVHRSSVW